MKMKLFFAAVAVFFSVSVMTSCGNKKTSATVEEVAAEQVCESSKECCVKDSLACDSTKKCCAEKAECAKKAECEKTAE